MWLQSCIVSEIQSDGKRTREGWSGRAAGVERKANKVVRIYHANLLYSLCSFLVEIKSTHFVLVKQELDTSYNLCAFLKKYFA